MTTKPKSKEHKASQLDQQIKDWAIPNGRDKDEEMQSRRVYPPPTDLPKNICPYHPPQQWTKRENKGSLSKISFQGFRCVPLTPFATQ